MVSSTRGYALGFGCGREVQRDREAEFAATGTDARRLVAELRDPAAEIARALEALPPGALERRLLPPRHLWGAGPAREPGAERSRPRERGTYSGTASSTGGRWYAQRSKK